mgnify:CR=1 FL=1
MNIAEDLYTKYPLIFRRRLVNGVYIIEHLSGIDYFDHRKEEVRKWEKQFHNSEEVHYTYSCGPGWKSLLEEFAQRVTDIIKDNSEYIDSFRIEQIKQKFDKLRIYFEAHKDVSLLLQNIANEIEEKSLYICEICGVEKEKFISPLSSTTYLRCQICN